MSIRTKRILTAVLVVVGLYVTTAPTHAAAATYMTGQTPACTSGANVNPDLASVGANVLRVMPARGVAVALPCIQAAYAAGYKVYLDLQFPVTDSPAQVAAMYQQAHTAYAPYLWAVGVGNEEELQAWGDGPYEVSHRVCATTKTRHPTYHWRAGTRHQRHGWYIRWTTARAVACRVSTPGEDYNEYWNAVEPLIASIAPQAIRVYGEVAPWGWDRILEGFGAERPPGVQAIAVHCYDTTTGGLQQVPVWAAWAARQGLPLWCSEMARASNPAQSTIILQTPAQYAAAVSLVEAESPDLQMVSRYDWRGL